MIARMGAHAHHLVANKRSGELAALGRSGVPNKQGNFEVHLDVGLFQPGELTVKLINDCIVVEGKPARYTEKLRKRKNARYSLCLEPGLPGFHVLWPRYVSESHVQANAFAAAS